MLIQMCFFDGKFDDKQQNPHGSEPPGQADPGFLASTARLGSPAVGAENATNANHRGRSGSPIWTPILEDEDEPIWFWPMSWMGEFPTSWYGDSLNLHIWCRPSPKSIKRRLTREGGGRSSWSKASHEGCRFVKGDKRSMFFSFSSLSLYDIYIHM